MVRRALLTLVLILGLAAIGGQRMACAENEDLDFTVHNSTGVAIHKLYISASSKADWEEDILGGNVLGDGDAVKVTFHAKETAEMWDVRIEAADGSFLEFHQLNLTNITNLYLDDNHGKAHTD